LALGAAVDCPQIKPMKRTTKIILGIIFGLATQVTLSTYVHAADYFTYTADPVNSSAGYIPSDIGAVSYAFSEAGVIPYSVATGSSVFFEQTVNSHYSDCAIEVGARVYQYPLSSNVMVAGQVLFTDNTVPLTGGIASGTVSMPMGITAGQVVVPFYICVGRSDLDGLTLGVSPGEIYSPAWASPSVSYNGTPSFCMVDTGSSGDCAGSTPGVSVPAYFNFPTSTYSGPDFSNWQIQLNGLATDTTYYGEIDYQPGDVFTYVQKIYSDKFTASVSSEGGTVNINWPVQKNIANSLYNYQNHDTTSSDWIALLYVSTSSNMTGLATSGQVTFNITPYSSCSPTSTPTGYYAAMAGPFFWNYYQFSGSQQCQTLASTTGNLYAPDCTPAASWTDIGGGLNYAICSAENKLFTPDKGLSDSLNTSFQNLKSTPPLVWLLAGPNAVTAMSQTSSGTEQISMTVLNYSNGALTGTTSSLVMASNNNPNTGHSDQNGLITLLKTVWFNLFLGGIMILTMAVIILALR